MKSYILATSDDKYICVDQTSAYDVYVDAVIDPIDATNFNSVEDVLSALKDMNIDDSDFNYYFACDCIQPFRAMEIEYSVKELE